MQKVPLVVSEVIGLDRKMHHAVVIHGSGQFPIALCGQVDGALSKESKAFAHLFADAPAMLELLYVMVQSFEGMGPEFNPTPAERIKIQDIIDRASIICARHN